MFTSLDLLMIVFMALAAVTLLSLALMFLIRNKTARKVFFYVGGFSGNFDVGELRRVFDNLISNVKKYAEPSAPVELTISKKDEGIVIRQSNRIAKDRQQSESYKMGLYSIRRIAQNYGGTVEVYDENGKYEIMITLSNI